jgi:hypothetical protein
MNREVESFLLHAYALDWVKLITQNWSNIPPQDR